MTNPISSNVEVNRPILLSKESIPISSGMEMAILILSGVRLAIPICSEMKVVIPIGDEDSYPKLL